MLSELQRRLIRIVEDLPEADAFALAGGGALVARGEVARSTRDLDYFATEADHVDRLVPALDSALRAAGLEVTLLRRDGGFARLLVTDGTEVTEIDLAADFRLLPPETTVAGRTLAIEELAVDKVLALFDRAEARDFVDLDALLDRWGLEHLCDRAAQKDRGFDRRLLAERLGRLDRIPDQEFGLGSESLIRLKGRVSRWRSELVAEPEAE